MTAFLAHRPAEVGPPSAVLIAPKPSGWRLPVLLGTFGAAATFVGSWVPSFWGDEAASVMSAERSLPSLLAMLQNIDAVHGVYYLFLHFWIQAFGASELSVRLPSAIAVGFVVAGTFSIGRMLLSRNLGVIAAVICAFLPRTSYLGADARSYAFGTAIAVWITVLFLMIVRHRFTSRKSVRLAWFGYAVGLAFGIYLFLYLGLLLLVHGAYLFTSGLYRQYRRSWTTSAVVTVALSLPILGVGYSQREQIAFLAHRGYATLKSVLVTQWFGDPVLATIAWILILAGVFGAFLVWRRKGEESPVVTLAMLWVLLPTLALLALNAITPAYNLRYASFCIPGVALALAAGIGALRHRALQAAAVAVLLFMAVPIDVMQRGPYAKDGGSDLAEAAALIGRSAQPGDAVVFDGTTAPRQRPRLALHLYPSEFAGLQDVALKTPYLSRSKLWDTTYPLSDVATEQTLPDHVWLIQLTGSPNNVHGTDIRILENVGYALMSTQVAHRTVVYSLVRHS